MTSLPRKARLALETALWVAVLGFAGYRLGPQVKAAAGVGAPGSPAPAVELRTLDGGTVRMQDLRGKVVLVNFWATWCPPCRVEMPAFQRLHEDRRADGLVVLGVSTDRGGEAGVRAFLRERGVTYPVAMAAGQAVEGFGRVRALPTSILIDRQGRVRQRVTGFFAEPALRLAVGHLLDEAGPPPGPRPARSATR